MKNFLAANDGTAVNSSHWEKLILSGPKYPLGKIELVAPVSETEIVILRNDMDQNCNAYILDVSAKKMSRLDLGLPFDIKFFRKNQSFQVGQDKIIALVNNTEEGQRPNIE